MATTDDAQQKRLAQMDWDDIEGALAPAAARGTRGGARSRAAAARGDAEALRDYFGEAEFQYLQKLASHAAAMRTRAEPLGNVVLVPGIMGSALASTKGTDVDLIWVNFARLALGRVERLRLNEEGTHEADSSRAVAAGALVQLAYARTILWLRARWTVEPYAFDSSR